MVAIASNIGSAYSTSFGGVIVSRIFAGVGSVALAIGAATVCSLPHVTIILLANQKKC
jgi:hypothetical protein